MSRPGLWIAAALSLMYLACFAPAQSQSHPTPQQARFFEAKIRPLLSERCLRCHGQKKQRGDLRLDSRAAILAGGDRGPAIVPGQPEKSLLIKAIRYRDDLKMPPSRKLSAEQIADLRRWVKIGAPWPGSDASATLVKRKGEFQITDSAAHWAFQPVKRPCRPVRNDTWVSNPIDAFILAELEAKGLQPNPPADKARTDPPRLLRPDRPAADARGGRGVRHRPVAPAPTRRSSTACSPRRTTARNGAGTGSTSSATPRPTATSATTPSRTPGATAITSFARFNDDKPYDRFIREQLAGDELPDADDRRARSPPATTAWASGTTSRADREQARFDGLDDIVATTGQVFLGLTVDCARCHDHKIDPIPQKDYYRAAGVLPQHQPLPQRRPDRRGPACHRADGRQSSERTCRQTQGATS